MNSFKKLVLFLKVIIGLVILKKKTLQEIDAENTSK